MAIPCFGCKLITEILAWQAGIRYSYLTEL